MDSLNQVPDSNRANNTLFAPKLLTVSVPAITVGASPTPDSFTAADQDKYYQVTATSNGALSITLTSDAGSVALYVGQGTMPTPSNYQQAADAANQASQTVVVPQALQGTTYYILAHSISGISATTDYTIAATQTSALTVSAISSYAGGNAGNVTVDIDGTNFTPTTTASLTLGGTTINSSAIDFASSSQIYATFNLTGAAAGSYTLKVQQGDNPPVSGPMTFSVVAASAVPLSLSLSVPQYIRSGRTGTITISYANNSNNDMVAPWLDITSTNANVYFSTPDDPNDYVQEGQVLAVAPSGPAGILRPGQSGQLTINLLSNDTVNNDSIPIEVDYAQSGQTIDWAAQEAVLRPSTISAAAWNVIWGNLMTIVGTTTDSFDAALGPSGYLPRQPGRNAGPSQRYQPSLVISRGSSQR